MYNKILEQLKNRFNIQIKTETVNGKWEFWYPPGIEARGFHGFDTEEEAMEYGIVKKLDEIFGDYDWVKEKLKKIKEEVKYVL